MRFHLVLIYFMLSLPAKFSSSAAAALSKFPIALPGCADHCGNISIPYPFGLTQECVYPVLICNSYKLTCNYSFNPPKLLWDQPGYREVIDISLDGQIKVNELVARDCYNEYGVRTSYLEPKLYLPLHFYLNITANKFTVVGCDASGVGWFGARTNSIGCSASCDSEEDLDLVGETCGGLGCCQTEIPQDVTGALLELKSTTNYTQVSGIHNCSYGFVAEKGAFNLSRNSVIGLKNTSVLPLIADWDIGGTCEEVRTKASVYACKSANSECYDHPHRLGVYRGYRCRCEEGYEGNPYLVDGCRDINECEGTEHPCKFVCINTPGGFNCSCPKGFEGDGRENGAGCVRLPPSKMVNVSIGLGSGIGFLLLLFMCIWSRKTYKKLENNKRKQKIFKRNGGLQLQQQAHEGTIPTIKHFSEEELDKATDHFNKCRILGQGAQGTVYKGMLTDGKIVAIKKSKQVDETHLGQFINEVVILSQINHRNVVKLLGCCLETEVPLLVYEFVPNGTLFELLHDQTNDFQISWSMRLRIASDIAGAVAYMHSASTVPVFHRDIKSSNILLDEKYVVKVSDFGTSKSVVLDQTHLTTLVKGTFGYLDPEYFQSSQFTDKSDVYSFGVVLVELLTGQRPISLLLTEEEKGLANRFLNHMESDKYRDMLDAQVLEEGSKEEVMAVARLARRCLNVKGKMRPTMKEVAIELESIRMSHKPVSAEAEFRKTYSFQTSETVLSDVECAWSSSVNSGTSTSYDHHPLMPETR